MESPAARLKSAIGTYDPSIWQNEFPIRSFAMSLRPGNWIQPEFATSPGVLSVAPHCGQLDCVASAMAPHQEHFEARAGGAGCTPGDAGCKGGGAGYGGGGAACGCEATGTRGATWVPQPVQNCAVSVNWEPQ